MGDIIPPITGIPGQSWKPPKNPKKTQSPTRFATLASWWLAHQSWDTPLDAKEDPPRSGTRKKEKSMGFPCETVRSTNGDGFHSYAWTRATWCYMVVVIFTEKFQQHMFQISHHHESDCAIMFKLMVFQRDSSFIVRLCEATSQNTKFDRYILIVDASFPWNLPLYMFESQIQQPKSPGTGLQSTIQLNLTFFLHLLGGFLSAGLQTKVSRPPNRHPATSRCSCQEPPHIVPGRTSSPAGWRFSVVI